MNLALFSGLDLKVVHPGQSIPLSVAYEEPLLSNIYNQSEISANFS